MMEVGKETVVGECVVSVCVPAVDKTGKFKGFIHSNKYTIPVYGKRTKYYVNKRVRYHDTYRTDPELRKNAGDKANMSLDKIIPQYMEQGIYGSKKGKYDDSIMPVKKKPDNKHWYQVVTVINNTKSEHGN